MQTAEGRYWHFFDNVSAEDSAEMRLWVALPPNHPGQETVIRNIHPRPDRIIEDDQTGNRIVFWRLSDFTHPDELYCYYDFQFGREPVLTEIDPELVGEYRRESEEYRRYTVSEPWIEITDEIRTKAVETAGEGTNPFLQSLRIFEWLLDNMSYEYPDPANRGAAKSFASMKGDCGEFSFVFCAMCRSLGIPARTITCMWLTEAGGHNWAEVLLPGYGWVPVDLSVAQGLAGKSSAFPTEEGMRAFAKSRKILEHSPYWLYGNLYSERLIISVGNNLEVDHPEQGLSRTFRFLQPGGSNAIPPAFEVSGFAEGPVQAGFFMFGEGCDDRERAKEEALVRMTPGYLAAGNYEMAEKGLRKKLKERPDSAQVLLDLGQCYINQGRFDEAIETLRRSLSGRGGSTKPVMDVWAHNLLGICYKAKGELEKAGKEFREVIETGIDFQNSLQFARDNLNSCE